MTCGPIIMGAGLPVDPWRGLYSGPVARLLSTTLLPSIMLMIAWVAA